MGEGTGSWTAEQKRGPRKTCRDGGRLLQTLSKSLSGGKESLFRKWLSFPKNWPPVWEKQRTQTLPTLYTKMSSKWTTDLYVKTKPETQRKIQVTICVTLGWERISVRAELDNEPDNMRPLQSPSLAGGPRPGEGPGAFPKGALLLAPRKPAARR